MHACTTVKSNKSSFSNKIFVNEINNLFNNKIELCTF